VVCRAGWILLLRANAGGFLMLVLGPMPESLRATVKALVRVALADHSPTSGRFLGCLLHGGPGGAHYLDENGDVWSWWLDDTVELVPDGPCKVAAIAIAAERIPELSDWLPRRPPAAPDCKACNGTGWLQPPIPRVLCPECSGMGWLPQ
jgi:hypothetical protein